jgi:hypothetical protein
MAQNVTTSVSGDTLIIKVNLKAPAADSKSGKTKLLASTGGFIDVPGADGAKVSLNVTLPK